MQWWAAELVWLRFDTAHAPSLICLHNSRALLLVCLFEQEAKPVSEVAPVLYVVLHAAAAQPLAEDAEVQFH
jgi:hypothetical protein